MAIARVHRLGRAEPELPAWRRWMRAVALARAHYHRHTGSDPLAISEAASVGLMLTAAGASKLVGLQEYPTDKRAANEDGWCYGRCDLWLTALRHEDDAGWAFEVKHRKITARSTRLALERPFQAAWSDAGRLFPSEGSKRIACIVYSLSSDLDADCEAMTTLKRLVLKSDVAWQLSGDGLPPAYVLLRVRQRGAIHR